MAHLNLWLICALLATVEWDGVSREKGRARWRGTVLATAIPMTATSPLDVGELVNSTCRDWVPSGNHTRVFQLISGEILQLDRFASALHLNGSISQVAATRADVCPGAISLCLEGFTLALWLRPDDTAVGEEGVYYLSSGAQRPESCGFYFRLDSVTSNPEDGSRVGVFEVGVATSDTFWQVRYQAAMSEKSHVMVMWSSQLGLDVYVDGGCVGTVAADSGYRRDPVALCSDDPFENLYIGRRNDVTGGYATGDIGQLTIWDAWMKPDDVFNQTDEGVLRAYFENCVPVAAISSLQPSYDTGFSNVSSTPMPERCQAACSASGYKYAAIGGDDASCSCLANYTQDETIPEGSCNVCSGYTEITCGGPDSLSLYRLTSFQIAIPSREAVKGLSVSFDGVELEDRNYKVTTQRNVIVGFSLSSGEDVFYSIIGDDRLEEIDTYETSAYLVFPDPGLYQLTIAATNEISRMELEVWVSAKNDPAASGSLVVEMTSDGMAATREPISIWLEMTNMSPSTECSLDFGDGLVEAFQAALPSIKITHRYDNPGVYLVSVRCGEAESQTANASISVSIQERVSITLNTTFRVVKGSNLSIPFQVSGTNVTDLAVLFDGIPFIANYTCSENFICEGYVGQAFMSLTGTHVFEIRATNLISGLVSSKADVYVGVPINHFSYEINATVITPNEWVQLTAIITEGTEVYFQFNYDSSVTIFSCLLAPCVVSQLKNFPMPGEYEASVKVSNDFNAFTSEIYSVKVYNPVPALTVDVINSTSTQDPITLSIYPTSNTSMWPTEATLTITINGFQNQTEESFTPSSETQAELTFLLIIPVYGIFVANLNVSNAVNSVVLQSPLQIGERITGFYARLPSEIQATGDNVSLEFGFSTGSEVLFIVEFGDGQTESHTLEQNGGLENEEKTISHVYNNAGDYFLIVRAQNVFDEKLKELSLRIVDQIDDLLQVATNGTNLATDVPVQFVFYLGRRVAIPQVVHCFVDYNDDSEIDMWNGSLADAVNITREHTFVYPGPRLIQANCSNEASQVTLSLEITLWQPATRCSVNSNLQVAATNTTLQFLVWVSNGSSVEFLILFGEGSNASINDVTGTQVFEHVYDEAGLYTVQLRASNPVSFCEANGGPIVIQDMIRYDDYHLQITPIAVDVSDPTTVFTITLKGDAQTPTNVTAHWNFGDGNSSSTQVIPTGARTVNTTHTYQVSGVYEITVHLSNMVSDVNLNGTLDILERIEDVDYNISTLAAVGHNLTLSILPASGSSLSYYIDFGDGTVITRFQDKSDYLNIVHSYDHIGTYILTIYVENKLGTLLFNNTEIQVLYPVQGLHFEASNTIIYSPGDITFSLFIDNEVPHPTAMGCVWQRMPYGRVYIIQELMRLQNVTIAPGSSVNVTSYFHGGQFLVSVTCSNALGKRSLLREVTVYEAISNVKITTREQIVEVGSQVGVTISTYQGSLLNYVLQFGDGQVEARFIVMADDTKAQEFYSVYTSPGLYTPSVITGNILGQSNATLNHSIEALYNTRELNLSSDSPVTLPNTLVTFTLSPVQGGNPPSNVHLLWDFGDGTFRDEVINFNKTHGYTCTHTYTAAETYQATVTVTNNLDSTTFDTTVVINMGAVPIHVSFEYNDGNETWTAGLGPDSNWFPIGSDIKMTANSSLSDATIIWYFGNGDISSHEVVYQRYEAPGLYNITLEVLSSSSDTLAVMQYLFYLVKPFHLSAIQAADESGQVILKIGEQMDFSLIGNGLDGPLCISWNVGDSSLQTVFGPDACKRMTGNDSAFIHSAQEAGLNFSHVYTLPGYYRVNVSVSNFYKTANRWMEVMVIGCWSLPQVHIQGPGETVDAPRTHRTTEAILLNSITSLDCLGISSTILSWRVYKLKTNESNTITERVEYSLPAVNGPTLDLEPGLLEIGLYEFIVTVTVDGFQNMTDLDRAYIRIEHSPLALLLEGGSSRAVGNIHSLIFDAMTSSYDPDNSTGTPSNWVFKWSCLRLSDDKENRTISANTTFQSSTYLCDNSSWEVLNFTEALIRIDPTRLRVDETYIFKAEVTMDSRHASFQQTVTVMQGEPPHASISCVSNCRGKTNPTSSFTLQGSCENCNSGDSQFTWSLLRKQQNGGEFEIVGNLGDMTSTGVAKQGIAFNPNQLEAGREYQLCLNIRDELLGNGFTQYSFLTNLPPYNGSCQIAPTFGYAITTEFRLECSDWLDEGYAVDRASISDSLSAVQALQYQVKSRARGQTSYSLKTSSPQSSVAGMIFGLGPEEFGYVHEVQIGVVDAYGATAYVHLTVRVERPSLTGDDITSLVSSNSSSLSLLVSSGNVEGATQLIAAVLSILPDKQDENSTLTAEEVTELRTELVLELGRISIWAKTAQSLFQASFVMALSLTGGVNDQILVEVAATMAAMAKSLEGLDSDDQEAIIDTAKGLTDGLGSLIAQSESIVQNTMATSETTPIGTNEPDDAFEAYGEDLSPEDIELKAAQDEEERKKQEQDARRVAMTISTLAQETLNLVSDVVLSQRVSGQPPVTLVTDKLTLEVFKDEPNSVAQRMINTSAGSFQLPNASSLFGGNSVKQVQQIVYSYNANPYSYSESSDTIGSKGVLSLEFKTGEGSPLSVTNLTDEISIILEVDKSKRDSAETVTLSFENASSVFYQKVELTEENVELRVNFKNTSDNSTHFLVYVRNGSHPNESMYDAFMEIPRTLGKDERWDDEGLEAEAKYTAVFPTEKLAGVGVYYLAVSIADTIQTSPEVLSTGANQTDVWHGLNATLVIYATGCRYWEADTTTWSSRGCKVGPLTTSHSTHCLCNHLSSFAASFFVPPNTIDFSTVFSKFLDLGDNAAVFSTVLGFFGLYLILLVWLRRKDKQDIVKWGVSPLADNRPSDPYFYQVTVQTGMGPGSGTRSKVGIILTGEDGDSGVRLLDDNKRKVFERGSICHFLMGVASPLGPLAYIKLWHDNSGPGQLASWYLSQVSIIDLQNGQQFFFLCDRWLAVEKDDGAVERVLPVASRSDLTRFSTLFYTSSRRNLFDGHIWFSLFSRPTRSSFTRVQRLSCCLCLLYLSMIANAMFYRTEETVDSPTAVRLGPFIFTLHQVFIGSVSALVVIPVNIIIVQIFRKSRPSQSQFSTLLPKHLQERVDGFKDGATGSSTPQTSIADFKSDKEELVPAPSSSSRARAKDPKESGKQFLLPHCCIYVAWLLIILSSLAAAFFTVLYSLEWGQEKSCEWLTSMLVSLVNSVIVIQPIKVLAVAIVVSVIFKKPSKMDVEIDGEFSADQNQLMKDEELLHHPKSSGGGAKYLFRPPPSKVALEEARQKRLKEINMDHILREAGLYTFFVALVLFLCYSNRDGMSFYMSESLRNIFLVNNGAENATGKLTFASLEKSTPDLFWDWVETALIPGLYSDTDYNGDPTHWRHTRFVSDWQGYRVGPVRLRQLRVKNESCKIPPDVRSLHAQCHLDYSWTNQDESNFTVAWQPQDSHLPQLYSAEERAPWVYHDFLDLNGVPYPGTLAVYSGGGYVAEFGTSTSRALSTTRFLRETGWYDELTRAIFVEFSVYNANVNLFSVATLLVESSSVGGAVVMSNVHTLTLYHYAGPLAIFTVISQVIFVAYLLYFIVKLILVVKKSGRKELKNFWRAVELAMLLAAVAAIVMFAFRQVFIELALQDVKNKDQGAFVNFSHIAKWDELFGYLLACVAFLSIIRYMRLLRLNARMSLLGMTLSHASRDIFYFAIMWNLIFFAFGQLTYSLFHAAVETFSSFVSTLETLFSMLLGKFDFDAMVEANRVLGGAVFLLYIMTMYMILTNMFVSIVVEAFTQMRASKDCQDGAAVGPEMVEFMMDRFKTLFLRPLALQGAAKSGPQATAQVAPYEDVVDSLEQQVNKIVSLVEEKYGKLDTPTNQDAGVLGSPARSLSHISLHPEASLLERTNRSPKKMRKRVILLA